MKDWVNWQDYLQAEYPADEVTFENFIKALREEYAEYTPEFAAKEAQIDAAAIIEVAHKIGEAGEHFATHNWRSAGSGNLGGWAVARCLHFLNVLTGSVGTVGGTQPSAWNKYKPDTPNKPPAQKFWNALHFPDDYPLAFFEMSFLLPHFLKEGRGKMDVYFSRVFNPVWTYPDGFSWMEVLQDEEKMGMHIALTPTWNETAYYATLADHLSEMLPIVYMPTVGKVCQEFNHSYRRRRGLYISSKNIQHIDSILANVLFLNVLLIVATDGERILGLGDLGMNDMGIPIGKISLHVTAAGLHPAYTLPVFIDVGTNNEPFLSDPLYLGLRQKRLTG